MTQKEELERYLDLIFGDRRGHLRFAFGIAGYFDEAGKWSFKKTEEHPDARWQERHGLWPDCCEQFIDEALRRAKTDDVYVCPYLGSTSKRSQGSALPSALLYADDATTDDERFMLIDSGGGGGAGHAYARLSAEFDSEALRVGNRAMRDLVGGDAKVSDNDVLRPAGTINHKTGQAVRLMREGEACSLEELGLTVANAAESPEVDPSDDFNREALPFVVRASLDEEPRLKKTSERDPGRSGQTSDFVRLCVAEGLDDATIIAAVLHHRPTLDRRKPQSWMVGDARRLIDLHRAGIKDPAPTPDQSSWLTFSDLLSFEGTPRPVPEIVGLAYVGRINLWSGESESAKTWAAIAAAVEEINAGRAVLWIDTDGMGEHATLERLQAFGATRQAIRACFFYVYPSDRLTPQVSAALVERLAPSGGRLVVCDSVNATMGLQGLDPMKGDEVQTFWRTVAEPFCKAGIGFVAIDHVTKSSEGRGPYAIGSERKHSGAYAHIGFSAIGKEKVVREGTGRSALATNKDRAAYFERPTLGVFVVRMSGGSGIWKIEPAKGNEGWKPTHLMEQVSIYLEGYPSGMLPTKGQVEDGVHGKAKYIREALTQLVLDGYVRQIGGERGALRFESLKPYRKNEEDDWDDLVPTSSLSGTTSSQEGPESDLVPSSRPLRDEDEDEDSPLRPHLVPTPRAPCVICDVRAAAPDSIRCEECRT